jgi:putative hydrolase of the HAD superfamily
MTSSFSEHHQYLLDRIRQLSAPMDLKPIAEQPVLTSIEGVKAVVFDFYGTMFISGTGDTIIEAPAESRQKAFDDAFRKMFPNLKDRPDAVRGVKLYQETIHIHKERMKSQGVDYPEVNIREVWKDVLLQLPETDGLHPDEELLEKLTVEFEMRDNPTWPMPDLYDTIESLHNKGLILGILSNSQFYTPMIYEAHFESDPSKDLFDINLCIYSFEERLCKPSLSFHKKLKRAVEDHYGFTTDEVLYVGNDMLKDIWPAHHFGFKTALFAGDARSLKWRREDERCRDLQPDLVITQLHQLNEYILNLQAES